LALGSHELETQKFIEGHRSSFLSVFGIFFARPIPCRDLRGFTAKRCFESVRLWQPIVPRVRLSSPGYSFSEAGKSTEDLTDAQLPGGASDCSTRANRNQYAYPPKGY